MTTPETTAAAPGNPKRKKALTAVTALVAFAGVAYGAYWALVLNHFESTDNAYVQGNVVQITPQVAGTVVEIGTDDTAHVKAGDVLVRFDPADARVALDQAEAQLAQTVREVRSLYANNSTLQAQIAARERRILARPGGCGGGHRCGGQGGVQPCQCATGGGPQWPGGGAGCGHCSA